MVDLISRQEAIDALWKALYSYEDKTEKQFIESEDLKIEDWMLHRIFVQNMSGIDIKTILDLPSVQPKKGKKFIEIVAEYRASCTYPEYEGKPYFSIRYEENGEKYEGFGTYKPEVLSEFLKEYFLPSVQQEPQECEKCIFKPFKQFQPERKKGKWIKRGVSLYRCSECGRFSPFQENYCPSCGSYNGDEKTDDGNNDISKDS